MITAIFKHGIICHLHTKQSNRIESFTYINEQKMWTQNVIDFINVFWRTNIIYDSEQAYAFRQLCVAYSKS